MSKFEDGWTALKVLVESLEVDVKKSLKGNKSASVRARKGLRAVKNSAAQLIRDSLEQAPDADSGV